MSVFTKAASALSLKVRALEDAWFDLSRRVDTSGDPMVRPAKDTIGPASDGYAYLPARARNVRRLLRSLPLGDVRQYTFIDMGSGKGRSLFIAAELAFRAVVGVEHSAALHHVAEANLRKLRASAGVRSRVQLVYGDAGVYEFPAGNVVLFLFNPFGPEVMGRVLSNLQLAIRNEKRHAIVTLLWPELSQMVADLPEMKCVHQSRRFDIFQAGTAGAV